MGFHGILTVMDDAGCCPSAISRAEPWLWVQSARPGMLGSDVVGRPCSQMIDLACVDVQTLKPNIGFQAITNILLRVSEQDIL